MDSKRTSRDRAKKSTAVGKLSGSGSKFGSAELENVGNTKAARSTAFAKHYATAPAQAVIKGTANEAINSSRTAPVPFKAKAVAKRSVLSGGIPLKQKVTRSLVSHVVNRPPAPVTLHMDGRRRRMVRRSERLHRPSRPRPRHRHRPRPR